MFFARNDFSQLSLSIFLMLYSTQNEIILRNRHSVWNRISRNWIYYSIYSYLPYL